MRNYRATIEAAIDREVPHGKLRRGVPGDVSDNRLISDERPDAEELQAAENLRLAAVLVAVVEHDTGPSVLLTRRADHLDSHSGQVAFPGGKVESSDATPAAAALREAYEEIGLAPDLVEIAGFLDTYQTGTGFLMLPVVGFVKPGFTLTPDENEVADVFEVPLATLMDAAQYESHDMFWRGKQRVYYSMDYQGYNIWGATAGVLMQMSRRLGL